MTQKIRGLSATLGSLSSTVLGKKLMVRVIIASSLLSLLLTTLQLYGKYETGMQGMKDTKLQIINSYSKTIGNALWEFNAHTAQTLTDGILAFPNIRSVELHDTNALFASSHMATSGEKVRYHLRSTWPIYHPHKGQNVKIGELVLVQSSQKIYQGIMMEALALLLMNMMKSAFIALVLLFFVDRLITRHLQQISRHLYNNNALLESKPLHLSTRDAESSMDEIDHLVTAINAYKRSLKSALKSLESSNARYKHLIEGSIQGVLILNQEWQLEFANTQAKTMFQLDSASPVTHDYEGLFGSVSQRLKPLNNDHAHTLSDEITLTLPTQASSITAASETRHIRVLAQKIEWQGQAALQLATYDITEKHQLRQQHQEFSDKLIQVNKIASLHTLAAGVAHQINNPNQAIRQNAHTLLMLWHSIRPSLHAHNITPNREVYSSRSFTRLFNELLNDTISSTRDIQSAISDIKILTQFNTRERCQTKDINAAILKAAEHKQHEFERSGLSLVLKLDKHLPLTCHYEQHLILAISHLLQNALDASQDHGHSITVSSDLSHDANGSDAIVIAVSDEGKGISAQDLPLIFDIYFSTRVNEGGSGVGLTLVKNILQKHAGKINVESIIDQGTTITMQFPVCSDTPENLSVNIEQITHVSSVDGEVQD